MLKVQKPVSLLNTAEKAVTKDFLETIDTITGFKLKTAYITNYDTDRADIEMLILLYANEYMIEKYLDEINKVVQYFKDEYEMEYHVEVVNGVEYTREKYEDRFKLRAEYEEELW